MSSLYTLTEQMEAIKAMDDIDPETLADTLESLEMEFDLKLSNIARWVHDLEGDSEKLDGEIDRLKEKKHTIDNLVKRLMGFAQQGLIKSGKAKGGDTVAGFRIQLNPPKLVISPSAEIPLNWFTENVERKLMTNELKQAISGGLELDGVELVQEQGIRIR